MKDYVVAGAMFLASLGSADAQTTGHDPPGGKPRLMDRFNITVMTGSYHIGERSYQAQAPTAMPIWGSRNVPLANGQTIAIPTVLGTDINDGKRKFNEFNPGIGVNYNINKWMHAGVGVYKNSLYRTSAFVLVGAETNRNKFMGAGIELGGVTGYNMPVAPSGLAYLRLGKETSPINLKLGGIPPVKDITPAVVTAQVKVNLGAIFKPK